MQLLKNNRNFESWVTRPQSNPPVVFASGTARSAAWLEAVPTRCTPFVMDTRGCTLDSWLAVCKVNPKASVTIFGRLYEFKQIKASRIHLYQVSSALLSS